jgi:hypothetical protein
VSWGAAMLASLVATIGRPRWWPVALAGFLLRGGVLVFLFPIVALPTPAGLANALSSTLTGFVFGGPSPTFLALVAIIGGSLLLWVVVGGFVAAALEVALTVEIAGEDGDGARLQRPGLDLAGRALAARLGSLAPLAAALIVGAPQVISVTYDELVSPGNLAVPIGLRVAARLPGIVVAIVAAWLIGDAAGGLAVRRLVLEGMSVPRAIASSWLDFIRRPSTLGTTAATDLGVLVVVGSSALAAGLAWNDLRAVIETDSGAARATLATFIAIWLAGLVLTAAVAAWRGAAWTLEAARRRAGQTASTIVERHRHASQGV